MSKDLLDLDNDNVMKNLDAFNESKISNGITYGDKTIGSQQIKQ